jgi:hypothetical protein
MPNAQKQVELISRTLRRHVRVDYQGFLAAPELMPQLVKSVPLLVPFRNPAYHGFISVLDWDHRLPSKMAILRVYAYYDEESMRTADVEFETRAEQIQTRNKYPEFDVPDYSLLTADEAYEAEVDGAGKFDQFRLVSTWRREIVPSDARGAVQTARKSEDFKQLAATIRNRPGYLGDLEAVSWTPPCESNHPTWTIDVWYLVELEGAVGKGRSFLVDLAAKKVVGQREFLVRSQ